MLPGTNHVKDIAIEVYDEAGVPHNGAAEVTEEGIFFGELFMGDIGVPWEALIKVLKDPEVRERIEEFEGTQ